MQNKKNFLKSDSGNSLRFPTSSKQSFEIFNSVGNEYCDLAHKSLLNKILRNIMGKRAILLFFGIITFVILLSSFISANFVCGEVNSPDIQAGWFNVNVYYSEDSNKTTHCKVSPQDNRFCCDPSEIKGVAWDIGKEINAEIFQNGYTAGPVNLIISGEGYDVFPILNLEEVIQVHSPNSNIIHSSSFFVNLSISSGFNIISYKLNGPLSINKTLVCDNCTRAEFYIENLTLGNYSLKLFASNGIEEISKQVSFARPKLISFSRELECKGCSENYVPTRKRVTIKVNLESSENVSGVLRDYFPVDWKFYRSDGVVEPHSETHNKISWQVNGNNITKEYILVSPRKILTRKYFFQSSFEDVYSSYDEVILFRFYRFLALSKRFREETIEKINYMNYNSVSPANPFVMFFKDNNLVSIAIFPSETVEGVYAYSQKIKRPKMKRAIKPFAIHSNLDNSEIAKILLRFKVRKPNIRNELKNVSLFKYNEFEEVWESIAVKEYNEDDRFYYYEGYSDAKGIFTIKIEEGRIKKVK